MTVGFLAYNNRFLDGTVSGPLGWATAHPLSNLLIEGDYLGAPARCVQAHDLAQSWFETVMPVPRVLTMIALFFHTMSLNARYRIRGALLADAAYVEPTVDTGSQWVFPSLYDPVDLEIDAENFITGTVTAEEIALLGPHLYAPLTPALAQRFRVELDDQLHPLGWFDIGGIYGVQGFSPSINFDRGRELSVITRDLVEEAPSGRRFMDYRRPRRVLSISYANLSDPEARRFVDAALAARNVGTVLFVPDLDDPAAAMREAFPATFGKLPAGRITWPGLASVAATFEEIIA